MGVLMHSGITYANVNMGMLDKMPYVYSTGKQSVALPLYSDDYPIIKTKIITNPRREQGLYIGDIASWSQALFGFYCENDGNLYFRATPYLCPMVSQEFFNFVDIEINYTTGVLVYDGVSYGNVSKTQEHAQVALFGRPSDRQGFMAIADVEIYKSGSLYMHLVPRKDESTGKGYLYDVVNDVSYQSDTATPLEYGEMPVVNEISPTPPFLYSLDKSQGGVWVNTNVPVSGIDTLYFSYSSNGVKSYARQIAVSDIAVYTGGSDVYTQIFPTAAIGKDFNVRIYNGELYVSFNATGASTDIVSVYDYTGIN